MRAVGQEHEKPSTGGLAKAPLAVQKSVKQLVGSDKINEFGTETTLGGTLSVVEFEIKGVEYAFGIDSAGNVVVRWVGVDQSVVPPAVIDTAKKEHPEGKVSEHNRNGWRQNVLFGERQNRQCPS